jgi:hypothetical protein
MKNPSRNKILVIVSSLGMLIFNLYAEWLPINGITRLDVLDSIPIYFMPSRYVYNIWYLIYALMIVVCIFLFFSKKDLNNKLTKWIMIVNLTNIVWVLVWHFMLTGLGAIASAIIFLSLLIIYIELSKIKFSSVLKIFVSVYTPWMMIVMLSNLAASNYMARGGEFFFSPELTAIFLIILITLPGVIALVFKNDFVFPTVILFALLGILTKHFYESEAIVAIASISSFILFVGIVIGMIRDSLYKPSKP